MKNFLLLSFLFVFTFSNAQNAVFTETFDGGLPDNWSALEIQGNGQSSANWNYTTFGPTGDFAIPPIQSTTAANGWMVFDSDLNCSFENQEAWLVSPELDGSDLDVVFLQFETFYRSFNDRPTIEVSTDSMTWTSFEVFPGIEANEFGDGTSSSELNPQTINIDISSVAAGQSSYWFAFRFLSDGSTENGGDLTGCGYAWQIDDVAIVNEDARAANDLSVSASFFAVAPNTVTPASQVEAFGFLGDIANVGSQPQEDVTFSIDISNLATSESVFSEELSIDLIGVDSTSEDVVFENTFTPADEIAVYEGTYAINGANADDNPSDNTRIFNFGVSDTTYSKWFNNVGLIAISPAADNSYAYGNCYYIPNGNGFFGRYVSFAVNNASDLVDRSVNILTYKWEGDEDENFQANFEEYNGDPIAFNIYTFDGTEEGFITVPMNIDVEDGGVPLEDDSYYFTVIQYEADDDQIFQLIGSTEFNYQSMFIRSTFDGSPRYASVLDVGNTGEFSVVGFGFDVVPLVDISISDDPDLVSSTVPALAAENKMKIYPSPADEFITLEMDFVKAQDVEIRFLDVQGRTIQMYNYDKLQSERLTYDLAQFAAGTYFVHVRGEEGVRTLKVSVK
ncbi:MAG: T9SS type A sorting domain-containing protein [Bacteroidota bacterium]